MIAEKKGNWLSGFSQYIWIEMLLPLTPLAIWPGFATQPYCEAPSDLQVKNWYQNTVSNIGWVKLPSIVAERLPLASQLADKKKQKQEFVICDQAKWWTLL